MGLRERSGEVVFSAHGRPYDWTDVVVWAQGWGAWPEFERAVRLGLACERQVDAGPEVADLEDDVVEAAANEFRYERGLLSAEETDAWLQQVGLTAEDWLAAVRRDLLRRRWCGDAAAILVEFPAPDPDLDAALWSDGIYSAELPRHARMLAARAAIYAQLGGEIADLDRVLDVEARAALARARPALTRSSTKAPRSRERLPHLARLEVALRRVARAALTRRAVRDQIETRRLDWIRLDCRVLGLPNEEAAREAALLVRADGVELSEVARLAHSATREERIWLEDAQPSLRERLLSAAPGELVGPLSAEGEFQLLLVRDKVLPTEADGDIRQRAERDILARLQAREIAARVQWRQAWCGTP